MKKVLLVLSSILSIIFLMAFSGGGIGPHSSGGAPQGYSGDPAGGNKTCNNTGCHTGAPVGTLTGVFSSNIPPSGYVPGTTYTVTANFVRPGHSEYGFQTTPQNTSGTFLGSLAKINSETVLLGSGKYITHSSSGKNATGGKSWNFEWTAPSSGAGSVTFYGAFNATNNNNTTSGDSIFKSTMVVAESPASVFENYADYFSLSVFPNPVHENLNFSLDLLEEQTMEAVLYDMSGRKIQNLHNGITNSGVSNYAFNVSALQPGTYFLRLNVDSKPAVKKIIKL